MMDVHSLEKPSNKLLRYYFFASLLSGPGIVIAFPTLLIRYNTLRYRFEDSGLRMTVGLLFRKEVVVAFRRVQDIHVSRNLVQRWLGIASVSIQTASGNAAPEIVLEGIVDADTVRDWLYERMRGAKGATGTQHSSEPGLDESVAGNHDQVTVLLAGIRDNLAILANREMSLDGQGTTKPVSGQST